MTLRRLLLACVLAAGPTLAWAAEPQAQPLPVPMAESELDAYRGGYELSPNLSFQFGAVIRAFEDGQLALQTEMNLSPTGVTVQQTAGAGVTPGTLGNVDLAGATGGAFSTPGGTTFIQNVANGQLTNFILNTASNHTFRQETNLTLVLPGFADIQSQITHNLSAFHLLNDMAGQTISALNH
jgi:hypothetical protein